MSKFNAVYEKYRHLDELLSDADWLDTRGVHSRILHDLWRVIRGEQLNEVNAVYEKYRHLDELLSDTNWLDMKDFRAHILHDLWSVIREEASPADVSGFENQRYGAAPSSNVYRQSAVDILRHADLGE